MRCFDRSCLSQRVSLAIPVPPPASIPRLSYALALEWPRKPVAISTSDRNIALEARIETSLSDSTERVWRSTLHRVLPAGLVLALLLLTCGPSLFAQSPIPAAKGSATKDTGGFTPGWTLGTRFEGSSSGDGSVYDLGSALGYNFSPHFGIDAGAPVYFVNTSSSIKKNNPGAVSGHWRWRYLHGPPAELSHPSLN